MIDLQGSLNESLRKIIFKAKFFWIKIKKKITFFLPIRIVNNLLISWSCKLLAGAIF